MIHHTIRVVVRDTNVAPELLGEQADSDIGDTLTYKVTLADGSALPSWLTFNAATRTLSGMPHQAEVGSLTFKVTATDSLGLSAATTFKLTVTHTNHAPLAQSATIQLQADNTVKINLAGLISDVDADALTITTVKPAHGTLTKNADGTYTYKPKTGYTGNDRFTYTASDGKLKATATISIVRYSGASITLFSGLSGGSNAPTIDWSGSTGAGGQPNTGNDWLPGFLGTNTTDKDLSVVP